MAFTRFETAQHGEAEAGAEAIEQRGQARTRLSGSPHPPAAREGAFDLLGRQGLDGENREDHVLDAEPGIDRIELR